ncbi:hypothetical protein HCN44_003897 [Aphidius gifuensis]|uniref:tRNA (uracil-O(2)-)-methyltransferase n=1 Tax=Aphidius gifuensis TaxID=684658 RepID=A0A834XVX9_APHGI|nr:probable tRNA (uracil-O(2)-)-methyltransferase [Aphidius gifuensis]KAF7994425.1 hypothetical protein HCN44_003897 [Aphidius gifuensis]
MMNFEKLISQDVNATESQFNKAIEIYLNKSHLINRRVLSSKTLYTGQLINDVDNLIDLITNQHITHFFDKDDNIKNIFDHTKALSNEVNPFEQENGIYLYIRKLFPRNQREFSTTFEFSILNREDNSLICIGKKINFFKQRLGLHLAYKIIYNAKNVSIHVDHLNDLVDIGAEWLKDKLFPRLIKWIEFDPKHDSFVDGSLNLVSPEIYADLYNNLKKKYGKELVEKWPECTDPAKFVYEDIAIATYLILLWDNERYNLMLGDKQSFVDLGCGNGLLVYILTSEGHPGFGIDLRKRKIWDLFSGTHLEEKTIIPSSKSLFPDTDWIIGNHSDELTPWIPVIAARSSYKTRFFLLPCCAHEFDGRKFQRPSAAHSQYLGYLKYIKNVCEECGFITNIDKLRIPSTKRICFIGERRSYPRDQTNIQDEKIEKIINERSLQKTDESINNNNDNNNETTNDKWSNDFKPRDSVEKVRNCTQIDKNIQNEIINIVKSELLAKVRIINSDEDDNKKWNAGGQLELAKLATIIPNDLLKKLKNECGGLQTLLRNHSHVFQINNGIVQFKIPGSETIINNKKKRKSVILKVKPCWFFNNHPDGCFVSDEKCNFKH